MTVDFIQTIITADTDVHEAMNNKRIEKLEPIRKRSDLLMTFGDDDAKETLEYTKESLTSSLQQANNLKNALREFRDALKANGLGG